MRPSSKRTTVAVLRNAVELSIEEFAKLIGKSIYTIRSLESGRLKLGEETALKISDETGCSARWLLENRPDAPMVASDNWPLWSTEGDKLSVKEIFEMVQAHAKSPDRKAYLQTKRIAARSEEMYSQWLGILAAARKAGKQEVAEYLLGQFLDQMKKRFGYDEKTGRKLDTRF